MHSLDYVLISGDKALLGFSLAVVVIGLPSLTDGVIILRKRAIHAKQKISARGDRVIVSPQRGMLLRFQRFPSVQKSENALCRSAVCPIEEQMMKRATGFKAFDAPLRFALRVNTEQVACIVPQEVWRNADRPLDRRRQVHALRLRLLSACILQQRDHLLQLPARVDAQSVVDFRLCPAGAGDFALLRQVLVIPHQCLQDHPVTPSLYSGGTSMTPSRMTARKNFGRILAGSE